jgi:hypothetical protein
MIYPYTASAFDSDAYGVDTDNPESAYEIIDNLLRAKDETAIRDAFNEWVKEMAEEYFNTSEWNDEWWEAWYEKVRMDII